MVFVRKKEINGKPYYYLVKSTRIGDTIKKTEKYLGKKKPTKHELQRYIVGKTSYLSAEKQQQLETIKAQAAQTYKKLSSIGKKKYFKDFLIKFTYNTNRIEGSTLTLRETSLILEDHIMPQGKTSKEVREAENHVETFNALLAHKKDLTLSFILSLHHTLLHSIDESAGKIRKENVAIFGSYFKPPKHERLTIELKAFFSWYDEAKVLHPFELAALVHLKFVTIHPFSDGNGRISRLLFNFILHKHGLPFIDFPYADREEYYASLEECQLENREQPFVEYCLTEYLKQYQEYLKN